MSKRVFIRIELKGTPSEAVYAKLHDAMQKKNWFRTVKGSAGETPLPAAMYTGHYSGSMEALAEALSKNPVANIWPKGAAILAIACEPEDWAQNGWWWPEH